MKIRLLALYLCGLSAPSLGGLTPKKVMSHRPEKISEILKRTLGLMVQGFVEDETGQEVLVTITNVDVTSDLKKAEVYCTIYPQDNVQEIKKALQSAEGHFRYLLGKKLPLYRIPEIKFIFKT